MQGNLACYIYPIPDSNKFNDIYLPFRLLIDGCDTINGKKLMSSQNGKLMVTNLESGNYEFTLLMSGTSYSFPVELTKDNSGFCKKLNYHRMRLDMYIAKSMGNGKVKEIFNNLEIFMIYGGIRQKVTIAGYNDLREIGENAVHLYRSKEGKDSINMCYPTEQSDTALIEFIYSGDLPVKNKKIKLPVDSSTDVYTVRF